MALAEKKKKNTDRAAGHEPTNKSQEATLLVVDDDPDILRVVKFYLSKQRYTVLTANNGLEALNVMRSRPDIELVMSDVMMPEMSGLDLLKHIRNSSEYRELPVILISAEGETSRKVAGLNLGADDFITKPFNFDELMARVRNHIRLRSLQRELLRANDLLRERNVRYQEDIESARTVQLALLPDKLPQGDHFKLASKYVPVDRVGGDFFDAVLLEGGTKLGILVADVCGHGVAAALITAMTKVSFRGVCYTTSDPAEVLSSMNQVLNPNIKNGFVTAFYAVFDPRNNRLMYASGGHPPLIVHRRSEHKVIELQPQETFLGFFENISFQTNVFNTLPGDRILFYTDGMYENKIDGDEFYSPQRMSKFLTSHHHLDLEALLTSLLDNLRSFAGIQSFRDDVTLVGMDID